MTHSLRSILDCIRRIFKLQHAVYANKYSNRSNRKDFNGFDLSILYIYIYIYPNIATKSDKLLILACFRPYRLHFYNLQICYLHAFFRVQFYEWGKSRDNAILQQITANCRIRTNIYHREPFKGFRARRCFVTIDFSFACFAKLCEMFGLIVSGRLDTLEGKHQPVND